jgi:hypothetical protein
MNQYKKNNTHGELKSVLLGSYYYPEYFKYIENSKIREPLMRIADEINQDLDQFETFLKNRKIHVIRPDLINVEQFNQHIEQYHSLPAPPLQSRNNHSVIGNQIYKIEQSFDEIDRCLLKYNPILTDLSDSNRQFYNQSINDNLDSQYNGIWFSKQKYQELSGPDWPTFSEYIRGSRSNIIAIQQELEMFQSVLKYNNRDFNWLAGPNIFPIDRDTVVIDSNEYCQYWKWAQDQISDQYRYISINTRAGHTDGCFTILGNKTILGIDPLIDYHRHFPGYTVIPVPEENYMRHIDTFNKMSSVVEGKWWVNGEEDNTEFISFIEKYCRSWTGFVEETVFDVNVLAIDPETVCVSSTNRNIVDRLHNQKIETVVIPWRHRFFVDGGLHCITLDLYRE